MYTFAFSSLCVHVHFVMDPSALCSTIHTPIPHVGLHCSRPLELDTDGIWCVLPSSFPESFEVRTVAYIALRIPSCTYMWCMCLHMYVCVMHAACVCVCVHVHVLYVHAFVHVRMCGHSTVHVCMCACVNVHVHVCGHTCYCTCMCRCVQVCVCACVKCACMNVCGKRYNVCC